MYPEELKYTKSHEWIKVEGKNVKIGITSFAIAELTDLTFLDISAEEGESVENGDTLAEVESVKTTSEIYAPVSGKIKAVNSQLPDMLDELMEDPYEAGWMVEITLGDKNELDNLLSAKEYEASTQEEDE